MRSLIVMLVSIVALGVAGCAVPEEGGGSGGSGSGAGGGGGGSDYTTAQEQAISAAESYLDIGTGFSREGLIQQLSSEAGNGFAKKDAVFAVDELDPNYNEQAVLAAQGYLDLGTGFSRASMIEQLTSPAGNQFTQAQAEFAVKKVGL